MIFKSLWERHLFVQLVKNFLFSLVVFYVLYVVIDCSIHSRHFSTSAHLDAALDWHHYLTYYFYLIAKRADIILALGFILSFNKVMLHLNQSNALIALLVGGLKKTTLLRPCFILATLIAAALLYNSQVIIPRALPYLESFENQNFRQKAQQDYSIRSTYHLEIQNSLMEAHLIFARYEEGVHTFEDVYYLPSFEEIWKMKQLIHHSQGSTGYYVDRFLRDEEGSFYKADSYEEYTFENLYADPLAYQGSHALIEQTSLSELYSILQSPAAKITQSAKTHLAFKLITPFISCLIIVVCAPFCMNFSRKLPIFLIYAISIFGVISFFIITDSTVVLCENKTMNPFIIISTPFLLCLTGFWVKFKNVCVTS